MTLPRPDDTSRHTAPGAAETDLAQTRDSALIALAREASLLALSAGREAAAGRRSASTAAFATLTLAAETERVARRIAHVIEAMRTQDLQDGPSDAQISAAAAALAAARAIGAHCGTAFEGTRVAAEGFAAAAAALEAPASRDIPPQTTDSPLCTVGKRAH